VRIETEHKGMRRLSTTEYRKNETARIAADVKAYLESGKKIQEIPPGVSGEERLSLTEFQRKQAMSIKT
jgi:hypothetical protein